MDNHEAVGEDLRYIGSVDYAHERGIRIAAARREEYTWPEIAALLGMTVNGAHKAYATYLKPKTAKTS